MHTLNTHKRLLALTVAMALSTPAAFAAENVWESIEVTAQKRNENISDVGIAITAFSGEQLEALGLEGILSVHGMLMYAREELDPSKPYRVILSVAPCDRLGVKLINEQTNLPLKEVLIPIDSLCAVVPHY